MRFVMTRDKRRQRGRREEAVILLHVCDRKTFFLWHALLQHRLVKAPSVCHTYHGAPQRSMCVCCDTASAGRESRRPHKGEKVWAQDTRVIRGYVGTYKTGVLAINANQRDKEKQTPSYHAGVRLPYLKHLRRGGNNTSQAPTLIN